MTRRWLAFFGAIALGAACDARAPLVFPSPRVPAQAEAAPPPLPLSNGPGLVPAVQVVVGQTVSGAVEEADPRCFHNWDATGRCRQYEVRVAADGTLVATLTGSGPSRGLYNTEVFLMAGDGSWTFDRDADAWPERHVSLPARRGEAYRVVVISYGPFPDAFEVRADVQP